MLSVIAVLPLKLQIGALDLLERNLDIPAGSGFECDDALGEVGQCADPGALIFDRLAQRNARALVARYKTLEIAGLGELALDPAMAN